MAKEINEVKDRVESEVLSKLGMREKNDFPEMREVVERIMNNIMMAHLRISVAEIEKRTKRAMKNKTIVIKRVSV